MRHSIIARLGPADTATIRVVQLDSLQTEIRFIDGSRTLGFGLGNFVAQLRALGIVPSDHGLDLAILAAAVTAADTRVSRDDDAQDSWTRELDLYIPVAEPLLWQSVRDLLQRTLNFLTGDHWRLFFRPRHAANARLVRPLTARTQHTITSLCLFSGGLDSFVGATDLFARGERPLLVSHYGDNSTSSQPACAQLLGQTYGTLRQARANVRFNKHDFAHEMASEPTTRGRSFLFFALAALAASGFDHQVTIYVPENGLISLNVPLDPLRVGAWSTRTTHPFYMSRWQELLRALRIPAVLDNPYRFKTKGEMLSECANPALLTRGLPQTISCSSFAKARWLGGQLEHCGFCVPCLIRRAAEAAAFGAEATTYTIDNLSAAPLSSTAAEGEHVRSFQLMAHRLAARPSLARILVHKSGPLSDYLPAEVAQYTEVFARGIDEVHRITRNVVVRPT